MLTRRVLAPLVALLLTLAGIASAAAAPPGGVTCPPGEHLDPATGTCRLAISVPPPAGGGNEGGVGGGGTPGGGGSSDPAKCTYTWGGKKKEVPCSNDTGWWSQSQQAYCRAASPQPPADDPAWEGHTDGQVYECTRPINIGAIAAAVFYVWLAQPPAGAPPDPRALARTALARMNLRAGAIGIVPESAPGRVGLVGMPTWMWVADPGASTTGPITRSVSAGGYTVTATGWLQKIVWDMGDGQSVTCSGAGTQYQDRYGKQSSPTCGYTYTRQGRYTVTASSYWSVDWSGIGQSGSIPVTLSRTAQIAVGEVQVLVK
ncbi:hypothetical protein LG324_13005 [Phycicoccus jejuensis]|uniref:hypothetical protein n=1 Tax=Phycicoccus jejuensis TaxID=367299 RepID=UPI003850D2D0